MCVNDYLKVLVTTTTFVYLYIHLSYVFFDTQCYNYYYICHAGIVHGWLWTVEARTQKGS